MGARRDRPPQDVPLSPTNEGWLKQGLWAAEALVANGDHLPIRQLVALLEGGGGRSSGHLVFEVQGYIAQLLLDVPDNLTLSCRDTSIRVCTGGGDPPALCQSLSRRGFLPERECDALQPQFVVVVKSGLHERPDGGRSVGIVCTVPAGQQMGRPGQGHGRKPIPNFISLRDSLITLCYRCFLAVFYWLFSSPGSLMPKQPLGGPHKAPGVQVAQPRWISVQTPGTVLALQGEAGPGSRPGLVWEAPWCVCRRCKNECTGRRLSDSCT